jgi:serine/threonine-protein kinase
VTTTASRLTAALADRYRIERELGRGGMATVYLAEDVRHHRKVALKVLLPELGAVLGVERFLAEIRVTANLQHPHLLPLFDSGEAASPERSEGTSFLFYVMPYVEGESLRARLERERQLPVDEALRLAIAIAGALDYAHRHGVIHRDLKPENVLLHEGQPLVADFGIALAVSNAGGQRVTQTGLSLGTPAYMSPEQATGDRAIDGRTDVYSLGAMLYEMLTGDPPHTASTAQAIIARVLTEKPRPVRAVRDTVPVVVEAAIDKALAKLPADRFASAGEFGDALQGKASFTPAIALGQIADERRQHAGLIALATSRLLLGSALLAATAVALWGWLGRKEPSAPPPVRFLLTIPNDERFELSLARPFAISSDGQRIIYAALKDGGRTLVSRALDELESHPIAGTEGAATPAISPDGRWVAFRVAGTVRKVPIGGGPSTVLTNLTFADRRGLAWLSNDELVVPAPTNGGATSLWRLSAAGGPLRPFAKIDSSANEASQAMPVPIPDLGLVLYSSFPSGLSVTNGRIAVARIADGRTTILDVAGSNAIGIAFGHLLYAREDGAIMAVPFDPKAIRVTGDPIPLLQGVRRAGDRTALSASGTLVYMSGGGIGQIVRVDERGIATPLITDKGSYAHPRFSPDGRRLAVDVVSAGGVDIWTYDVASGTSTRLTSARDNDRPEWTPDGKRVLYLSSQDAATYSVWWQPADGSTAAEELYRGTRTVREAMLLNDGRTLVVRLDTPDNQRDINVVSLTKPAQSVPLVTTAADELMPRVSPDGKWLAYQSNESGQYEIYVRPFPGGGSRTTVSNAGGTEPIWSRDGCRLFYRNGSQLVAAGCATSPSFAVTSRQILFSGNFDLHAFHPNYDVAPDGRHFAMISSGNAEPQVVVVANWLEELRQRLGKR